MGEARGDVHQLLIELKTLSKRMDDIAKNQEATDEKVRSILQKVSKLRPSSGLKRKVRSLTALGVGAGDKKEKAAGSSLSKMEATTIATDRFRSVNLRYCSMRGMTPLRASMLAFCVITTLSRELEVPVDSPDSARFFPRLFKKGCSSDSSADSL